MDFRIISPTIGLQKFATLSTSHLILAQVTDKDYQRFYLRRRRQGDHIILDNGAHELGKAIDWNHIADMIDYYDPQVVVLPDVLNDPIATSNLSLRFLDTFAQQFPQVEWMYVVQAMGGILDTKLLDSVIQDSSGKIISWFGITRYLAIDNGLNRAKVIEQLKDYGRTFHALGMVNGSVAELKELESVKCDSADSSVPVWRGWNGYSCDPLLQRDAWPEISVDFSCPREPLSEALIYSNIKHCLEASGADTSKLF